MRSSLFFLMVVLTLFALGDAGKKKSKEIPCPKTIKHYKKCLKKGFVSSLGCDYADNKTVKGRKIKKCEKVEAAAKDCGFSCAAEPDEKIEPQITSLTASNVSPVEGETITLTCVATGETAPTFEFIFDSSSYDEVEAVTVSSDGTTHTATQVFKTGVANVLSGGLPIECEADYGDPLNMLLKEITVTTYYDCSAVAIPSLNEAGNGATVTAMENEDGSLTQTITCPANTDTTRFSLNTTSNSGASITCSKNTGRYEPSSLASCEKTTIYTTANNGQMFHMSKFSFKPCSTTHPSAAAGKWSKAIMEKKLFSMTDTVCGFRHAVPCLINDECTLDTEKSECRFDHDRGYLILHYYVNLKTPVWSPAERDALATWTGRIQFWRCSESYE